MDMARHSGRAPDEIQALTDRDRFLKPEEALELGIIDGILDRKENLIGSKAIDGVH